MIEVGKKAPHFTLVDGNNQKVSLSDFIGSKVILYFYPKDMTSGCTQEACDFKESFPEFSKLKIKVIGISADSVASHKKFSDKYNLPFTLLSDENKKVLEKYCVWKEKSMYGRKFMGIERTTIIIDEMGKIQFIFPKVKVAGHVEEILKTLKSNK